jgi:hypothetical protein
MNEKFGMFESLFLIGSLIMSDKLSFIIATTAMMHHDLSTLRASLFCQSHPDIIFETRDGWIGFYRPSDSKFYRLHQEQPHES